jgi:PHD/YefM family antitoxin component YafN of YafNO toxin-antitoxin module
VRSAEAQDKFRALLDEVGRTGAHVYILRYEQPEAVMVPVGWYEHVKAALEADSDETDT